MPGRCALSATPSTFQNAVAASTRWASSALTASNPIVVDFTLSGSPPSPCTIERSTATSDGRPLTPARLPSGPRGGGTRGGQRRERPLDDRHHADDVGAVLAGEREVVDVEDRHVHAAGPQQLERVGRRAGRTELEGDAFG